MPSYITVMVIGVLLAIVSSRFPDNPFWNKASLTLLAVAVITILYGFNMYADAR
jgi:hypothetical protein